MLNMVTNNISFLDSICKLSIISQGMPGAPNMKMYSREDLMNMNNFGGEDDDEDDEDDEDEDDKFPANLVTYLTCFHQVISNQIFFVFSLNLRTRFPSGENSEGERQS